MSTTIAIGISTDDPASAYERMEQLAAEAGYGLARGVQSAEADCRTGLSDVVGTFDLTAVVLLKAPSDLATPLAPAIQEELLKLELEGERPAFFQFLFDTSRSLRGLGSPLVVSFSGEWQTGDRVRLHEGTVEELVELLKRPGNWYQRLFMLGSGRWQDSDEVPLVFVTNI